MKEQRPTCQTLLNTLLLGLSCTLIKEVVDVNINSGHEHETLKVTSIVINISAVSATISNWVAGLVISLVHVKETPKLLTKDATMAGFDFLPVNLDQKKKFLAWTH